MNLKLNEARELKRNLALEILILICWVTVFLVINAAPLTSFEKLLGDLADARA